MSKRTWSNNDLIMAVKNSETISEVINALCITHNSRNVATVNKYINNLNLDTGHWKSQAPTKEKIAELLPEQVFIVNSTFSKTNLRWKILKYKLLSYQCAECGLQPIWNNKSLSLQLDHINGIGNDNRLENLRFLCPNCHSQTETYAGSNNKGTKLQILTCIKCGGHRSYVSKTGLCRKCKQETIKWPDNKIILDMIDKSTITETAKQLNCSTTAIKARLKRNGLL
jgi:Zn finger protein HypA/HybF involved in hydrogenase expression